MSQERDPRAPQGWSFGRFRLIVGRGLLDEDGTELPIAPKPLAVLVHLLRNPERVVDRTELLERVWEGVSVSEAALSSVLRDLRRVLGESANDAAILRTVRGRGLRIDVPVRELAPEATPNRWDESEEHLKRALHALELVDQSRGVARDPTNRARADLLVALARIRWAGGSTASARKVFAEAASLGRAIDDPSIFARAALGSAGRTDVPLHLANEVVSLLEEALERVPVEEAVLAAEVRARLATEIAIGDDVERARRLADDATALAEVSGDVSAIAYAKTARHFVLQRLDVPLRDRVEASRGAQADLAGRSPSDVFAIAQQQELIDRLEGGERERFDAVLGEYEATSASLGQPFFEWMYCTFSAVQLLLDGDLERAERRTLEAHELGVRAGSPNADLALAAQLFVLRRDQGRLAELLPLIESMGEDLADRRVVQCARAAILAAVGDEASSREALDAAVPDGLLAVPRDHDWMTVMGLLTPVVARFGSDPEREALEQLLQPLADRIFVFSHGVAALDPVCLGLAALNRALGRNAQAEAHERTARSMMERLRAPVWCARFDGG